MKIMLLRSWLALCLCCSMVHSANSAAESSVELVEPMQGFPPARNSQVTAHNYLQWPANRWSFSHIGAVLNTVPVPRSGGVSMLPQAKENRLADFSVCKTDDAKNKHDCTLAELFATHFADGLVILQNGEIVAEHYFHDFNQHSHHIWFSATKSLVATAFGVLVEQYQLKLNAPLTQYIPELAGTGWQRVNLQQLLNHSTAIDFQETYTDQQSDFFRFYLPAMNMMPNLGAVDVTPADESILGVYDFLREFIRPNQQLKPGEAFEYSSPNADMLGWLIARISGMPVEQFIQQTIWSSIGAEHDAFMVVDRAGMAVATGGMNSTLRDAARFAELVRLRGRVSDNKGAGQQIVPSQWIDASLALSSRDVDKMQANPGYRNMPYQAYRNMWWVLDAASAEYMASGVYGQVIYINRAAGISAVWFSSQPVAAAPRSQSFQKKLSAVRRAAAFLQQHPLSQ